MRLQILALAVALMALPNLSYSGDLLELRSLDLTIRKFSASDRLPLITQNGLQGRALDKEFVLGLNVDLLKVFYYKADVRSMTDRDMATLSSERFRTIGLEYNIGIRLTSFLSVSYYHYSQHLMDAVLPYSYPIQNAVEIKINLYNGNSKGTSVFDYFKNR